MVAAAVVVAASLLVDRLIGDPHSRYHPVALLGRFIGWWGIPSRYPVGMQRAVGIVGGTATVALFAVPFLIVQFFASRVPLHPPRALPPQGLPGLAIA